MALREKDIRTLLSQRRWYSSAIQSIENGEDLGQETEDNQRVDTTEETVNRFRQILMSIEHVLTNEGVDLTS